MEYILAAISLGFLGSFHCVGMCGPIALALPVHQQSAPRKILSILAYNSGRIITYTLFGALFGMIGQSFALFGYQQKLSIIIGSLILIALLIPKRLINTLPVSTWFYRLLNTLKHNLYLQFQKRGITSFLSIGLLNGLLPCGLVYMGIAGAVATGSVLKGMLFMAVFGVGTLPFMFAISYTSHLVTMKTRNIIRKSMPVVIGIMAVLLIFRGLNLGINYISPKLMEDKPMPNSTSHKHLNCCHKN